MMELETGVETALPVPFGEKEAAPLMLLMDKDHGRRTLQVFADFH
jgi:hypothetical protein